MNGLRCLRTKRTRLVVSAMTLAGLLTGCAANPPLECPKEVEIPAAMTEKRMPGFEVYSQKLSNFFRKVENFAEASQEPTTPLQMQ